MRISTRSSRRSVPGEDAQTRHDAQTQHDDEARLALAEKEVARALDSSDYDRLASVATEALSAKPQSTSKEVIKSRKNLYWARSHAHQHKGAHDLALRDAKSALKLDPEDPGSYLRTASMLVNAEHLSQAESCLEKASALVQRLDAPTRQTWLRKIQKQRRTLNLDSSIPIDVLPNEVLIQVAQHLEYRDRCLMSQTCRKWRQTLLSAPALWRSITLTMKAKRLSKARALSWLQHVEMCANRAKNTLESVSFVPIFPNALLTKVLLLLQPSAATLVHLTLPADDQQMCYDMLYRYCPRLNSIDCTVYSDQKQPVIPALDLGDETPAAGPLQLPSSPFSLRYFRAGSNARHPDLFKHMRELRVLKHYNPPTSGRGDVGPLQNVLISNAATLEELQFIVLDSDSRGIRIDVTLPNVVKASVSLNTPMRLRMPKLQILGAFIVPGFQHDYNPENYAALLSSSADLRSLELQSLFPLFSDTWLDVLQQCPLLEHLRIRNQALAAAIPDRLLPTASRSESGESEVHYPFAKLQSLELDAEEVQVSKLTTALAVRERLRLGDSLYEAHQAAAKSLEALKHNRKSQIASPFQRGSRSNEPPPATQASDAPRLRDPHEYPAMKVLRLFNHRELPADVEREVRAAVPDPDFDYDGY